jgi:hypothetical protein
MTSRFYKQFETCARSTAPLPHIEKGDYSPLIPRPIRDEVPADRRLEHKQETVFLKALIAHEEGEASLQLQDNLAKAARERKCLRRAMFLMVTLFLLSLAGLGFCALWLPHVFSDPTALATKSLIILGLASLISQLEFFGYLLWHRIALNRLHKECRLRVLHLVESRIRASLRRSPAADSGQGPPVSPDGFATLGGNLVNR